MLQKFAGKVSRKFFEMQTIQQKILEILVTRSDGTEISREKNWKFGSTLRAKGGLLFGNVGKTTAYFSQPENATLFTTGNFRKFKSEFWVEMESAPNL